jgi:putative ABC transport system permease protein
VIRFLYFAWTATALAMASLRRHLLRAFLTSLGILIGVAAVTIVVALGQGASQAVAGTIDALGDNALMVNARDVAQSGARGDASGKLTEGDAEAISREATSVRHVAPMLVSFSQIAWEEGNESAQIIGTTLDFFEVRAWKLADGSYWTKNSENTGEKVCLIGATVRAELFAGRDPIGRTLRIGRYPFTIVGVLEDKGQSPFGFDQNDVVVMPLATVRARLRSTAPGVVDRMLLSAVTPEASDRASREVRELLRQRHGLTEGMEDDFTIRSQEEFRRTQEQILSILSGLLLAIAGVSLVAGGIGIMNIMLVGVSERTREIGIRMAIGARERDILAEFLVEAVILSLVGGLAGAAVAAVAIAGLAGALGWPMTVSAEALAVALITSMGIGLVFGIVPARRAARLDPIDALARH